MTIAVLLVIVLQAALKKIRLPQETWFSLVLVAVFAAGGGTRRQQKASLNISQVG